VLFRSVDTKEQGQGIGKMLMQSVENIAFQKNIKKIIVYTQLENKKAMAFYHSCGYTIKEQKEIYHLWIH
jgi:dTDP-4-amino-4,6-dideoxy-D-galactose acyltransferase